MADKRNAQDPKNQDGAVEDVDAAEVQADTEAGGAPEEPDTNPDVYSGD